jgi:MFS family permease
VDELKPQLLNSVLPPPAGAPHAKASVHPVRWLLLIIPFGAITGFTTVALGYLATQPGTGLTSADAALIVAFGMAPQVVKFLWAPLCDMTFDRKRWYLFSSALCIAGVVGMSALPLNLGTLFAMKIVVLLASLATSFLGMAVEGMVAHLTPPEGRGRAGGWLQAGNLGGGGVGGGFGLYLMTHLPQPWMAGAVISACFALCGLGLVGLPEVPADQTADGVVASVKGLVIGLYALLKSPSGVFAAILCFAPISTGAAGGVLAQATVAAHWGATESDVELVNGLLAGLITAMGSFVGGLICGRLRARTVYAVVGGLMAVVALIMAYAPATRTTFTVGLLVYTFGTGLAYASWTGFILETIGAGAAATKYNIFASLSNMPITYMGIVLGYAVIPYGADGMLIVEAIAGFAGIVLVLATARLLVNRRAREAPAPVAAAAA